MEVIAFELHNLLNNPITIRMANNEFVDLPVAETGPVNAKWQAKPFMEMGSLPICVGEYVLIGTMPDPSPQALYIVQPNVARALPNRKDLLVPCFAVREELPDGTQGREVMYYSGLAVCKE